MPTLTGDKLWAVFNSDGCECSELVGVFATREQAEIVAGEISARIDMFYARDMPAGSERLGFTKATEIIVGYYILPAECQYEEENVT